MISDANLPDSWTIAKLEEIAKWGSGGTPSRTNSRFYEGTITWIKTGELVEKYVHKTEEHLSEEAVQKSSAKLFPKGSVGIAMYGATIGKTSIFGIDASTNQACAVAICDSNIIHNEYLYYFLGSQQRAFVKAGKGGAQPNISQGVLKDWKIPFAPLNEQKRIVEKIEELFSELDKGIESLKTAREQLKIYRQSALKHAFEGKLTENWRKEKNFDDKIAAKVKLKIDADRAKIFSKQLEEWEKEIQFWQENGQVSKKPSKPRKPENPDKANPEQMQKMWDLPISWQWLQVGEFSFVTKLAGFEYTEFVKYDENGDLPVLKAENAGLHGFKPTKYSLVKSSTISHLKRSYISGGELLVVFVGAGTGNVARVPDGQNFFLGPNIGMARVETDEVSTKYLELFLRSPLGKDLILASVKAVAQPSISMGTIRQTPVAIPTIEEQIEIVSLLNDALEKADLLDADLVREINKSEALRQSILKSAFSGKLVTQDPNDEPASVLLERIKAEQAKTIKQKASKLKPKPKVGAEIIPFPSTISSISTTDLHAGIIALAYSEHEKYPKQLHTLGHVKAEKIAHLVEYHLGIPLGRHPVKDAAGPNDYNHLKKIEHRANMVNWFSVQRREGGQGYYFTKKNGFEKLISKTTNALGEKNSEVINLIRMMLPLNTQQAEIVATLFAAWNNLILSGETVPNDEAIVTEARENWHESKLNIERERFFSALTWLRKKNLIPSGIGKIIDSREVIHD